MRISAAALTITALACSAWGAGDLSGSGIVVLDLSAEGALNMVGSSTVEIPAKAVYVNSSSSMAVRTTGNAMLDCPRLYVMGGTSFSGNSGCTGVISHPPVAYQDPMSNVSFPSSSGMQALSSSMSGDSVTLQPGYYPQQISVTGNKQVTFSPGVYILGNGIKVTSGSIIAAGVCLVIQGGSVNIAGTTSLQMSPPSSGAMAGLVIAQPSSNANGMSLAGGSGVEISGTFYAPGAMVTLTGNSTVQGIGPQMGDLLIAKTVKLAGTGTIKIGHAESAAIVLPSFPLAD